MQWVGIVIPAHNEAERLPSCLHALTAAQARLLGRSSLRVDVLVVLDGCTDGSRAASAATPTLEIDARNVGAARRAGFEALLAARPASLEDRRCWLATSDADSTVPEEWLLRMLAYADAGWDAVAGTVGVTDWEHEWGEAAPRIRDAWAETYQPVDCHPHVHGANLGVRVDSYRRVGGMPAVGLSEDAALVALLEATGHRVRRAADLAVVTSSRRAARADGGFASFLDDLSA